jgi:hypothetical protein
MNNIAKMMMLPAVASVKDLAWDTGLVHMSTTEGEALLIDVTADDVEEIIPKGKEQKEQALREMVEEAQTADVQFLYLY